MEEVDLHTYIKPIREADFTREEESAIWDFYVTRSLSRAASQQRTFEDYRPSGFGEQRIRLERLLITAGVNDDGVIILRGQSMNSGLDRLELLMPENIIASIHKPRIACINPLPSYADSSKSNIISLMIHIRNALAHGRTYFFSNGFIMMEDNIENVITARFLFHKRTLLDWIRYFDRDGRFYPELLEH